MWGGQYKIQKTQGFATLLFTMVVLASITAFAFISASTVVTNQASVKTYHQKQSAFNIAQAGLDYAIPYLDANYSTITNGSSQQINIPGGGYATLNFAFVGDKNTVQVTSTGYANGNSNSASVKQLVKYQSASTTKTLAQPFMSPKRLTVDVNGLIVGNPSNLISILWGGDGTIPIPTFMTGGSTQINGVTMSKQGSIGSDVVLTPSLFAGKTSQELETAILGKKISEFANVTAEKNIASGGTYTSFTNGGVTRQVAYFNQAALDPYKSYNSINIDALYMLGRDIDVGYQTPQSVTLGTAEKPITLVISLAKYGTTTPMAKILNKSKIYGDVIVRGGNLEIDAAAQIFGNVIVESGTATIVTTFFCGPQGASSTCSDPTPNITGSLIASGDVLINGGIVNGIVYTNGILTIQQGSSTKRLSTVNGAVYAGERSKITTSSKLIYNADLAKITSKGSGSSSGYARVAGSWTDL